MQGYNSARDRVSTTRIILNQLPGYSYYNLSPHHPPPDAPLVWLAFPIN